MCIEKGVQGVCGNCRSMQLHLKTPGKTFLAVVGGSRPGLVGKLPRACVTMTWYRGGTNGGISGITIGVVLMVVLMEVLMVVTPHLSD